ncbi:cytochrome P450 2U1-like [Haemaphysalis longicornis]
MAWHLLNCADKPITVQARIQKEVDEVVGPNRLPSWRDHYSMPFTMATIFEMHRWRPVLPMGLPRGAEDDIKVNGYVIPKGAIVMPNLWALSMDKGLWDNPELFYPNRFMDPGTGKLKQKPKYYIPFSVGKRMCPAEGVAQMEIFLLLTAILQHFSVCPAGPEAPWCSVLGSSAGPGSLSRLQQ